jgi:hypothetical protein
MSERYPGYDVLSKRDGPSWNEPTRQAIDARLRVPRQSRFFTEEEWRTLQAICEAVIPQDGDDDPVPLAAYVDQKMAENHTDGFRHGALPRQGEAWRRGLAALEAEARDAYDVSFHALSVERREDLLRRMQAGGLENAAWSAMPSAVFFEYRVVPDITHAFYAHPKAWSEIGFGGPASPRGYVRLKLGRRDPWEAAEARPGGEAAARRKNERVR